ncbi:MAG: PilN domain-containing protein [Methylococcales bacterium]
MARINLLPWREELRRQKKKDFLTTMGGLAFLTLAVFGFIHTQIQGKQEYQQQRNAILEEEIIRLDVKLGEIKNIEDTKNKLLAKIELIQKLQESRPEVVHLLDEIPRNTPDGVFLTKFSQTGQALVFEGKSQSNARVSAFMRAIDASNWLQSPVLEEIKAEDAKSTSTQSNFKMKATLGKPTVDATKVEVTK